MPARNKISILCRRLHLLIAIASLQSLFTATSSFGQATEWNRDPSNVTNYDPSHGGTQLPSPPPLVTINIATIGPNNSSPTAQMWWNLPNPYMQPTHEQTRAFIEQNAFLKNLDSTTKQ